jgi:hypothetical protein
MVTGLRRHFLILATAALLVSCGDQPLFMSLGTPPPDMQITSVPDGQIMAKGAMLPLTVNVQDPTKSKDVEVEVTITSSAGEVVFHDRSPATLNQATSIALPAGIATGLYRLDVVVYTGGEVTQKKSSSFFVAPDGWKIVGVSSFPPLITTKASVMLKADLQYPANADPWLRWSWKGKAIARGLLSQGFDQILWVAPSDEGVYSIALEMFPSAPADSDYAFTSSLLLSTDIFVTNGKAQVKGDLWPESSYLTLLHLQANLNDSGTGAKANGITAAVPVGNPLVVSLEDGFGYRLDGKTGIRNPWLPLPALNGTMKPFTISIGVAPDDPSAGGRLLFAQSADQNVTLAITLGPDGGGPHAVLTVAGQAAFDIPWKGSALAAKKRTLVSLSITPQGTAVTAQWFLDGVQQSSASATLTVNGLKPKGSLTIGGDQGFTGVLDEFGVYDADAAGKPSTDPDLFQRSQSDLYGSRLVFADGFDSTTLTSSFTAEGSAPIYAGTISLAAGSALGLPPLKLDGSGISVTAGLTPDSGRTATVVAQWEGSTAVAAQASLTADVDGLHFRLGADGLSLIAGPGAAGKTVAIAQPPESGARLLLTLHNPSDARALLVLTQVLAVTDQQ